MRYAELLDHSVGVDSSVVKGGCKTVVGDRCKCCGMHRTVDGANAILALRCSILNGRTRTTDSAVWRQAERILARIRSTPLDSTPDALRWEILQLDPASHHSMPATKSRKAPGQLRITRQGGSNRPLHRSPKVMHMLRCRVLLGPILAADDQIITHEQ